MNGPQIFVALFALLVIVISAFSVIVVIRSDYFKLKTLWIIGCLFGLIGFGIDWTIANDVILLFGITIPVVMVFKVAATGHIIVKTGFPFISVLALSLAYNSEPQDGG